MGCLGVLFSLTKQDVDSFKLCDYGGKVLYSMLFTVDQ